MPEDGSPSILLLNQMAGPMTRELAEDLGASLGPVALLTGHPDTLAKASTSAVKLFSAAPYERGSFGRRAVSWLRYTVQALFWLRRWPRAVPVLVFSNPPILCWLTALLAVFRGQPYAVMIHDIYPDVLVKLAGFSEKHPLIRTWRWLNRQAYQRASAVLTLSAQMAANLEVQFDASRTAMGRVVIIPPWVDTAAIKPMVKEENDFARAYGQVGKVTVMYSGNMGLGHDIETMLKAAEQLQGVAHLHFVFIGAGPKWSWVREMQDQRRLSNVTLLPWQPEEMLPWQLACADIGLVSLETEMRGLAVPSKVFYMMAAGAALMVLSARSGDLEQVVQQGPCGQIIPPGDTEGLVEALLALVSSPETLDAQRRHARHTAEVTYERRVNTGHFRACLVQVFPALGREPSLRAYARPGSDGTGRLP